MTVQSSIDGSPFFPSCSFAGDFLRPAVCTAPARALCTAPLSQSRKARPTATHKRPHRATASACTTVVVVSHMRGEASHHHHHHGPRLRHFSPTSSCSLVSLHTHTHTSPPVSPVPSPRRHCLLQVAFQQFPGRPLTKPARQCRAIMHAQSNTSYLGPPLRRASCFFRSLTRHSSIHFQ